jgi:hypothetical protein
VVGPLALQELALFNPKLADKQQVSTLMFLKYLCDDIGP